MCLPNFSIVEITYLVVNIFVHAIVTQSTVLSVFNHLVSFHIPTLQMFMSTSGSQIRLIYELFSDYQNNLLFFVLIYDVYVNTIRYK